MTRKSSAKTKSRDNSRAKPPPRRLANYLCFAIYTANLAYGRAYKQGLDQLGLTYPQWIAILALGEQDDQTVSELGDKVFLESNTLTPVLKKLEAMGYLSRRRDPADERQVRVNLTDAGRRLLEKGLQIELVKSNGLKPDDFDRLQNDIVTLRDNLIKATQQG
jgi:MarR family transcriptional regulator, organic hydroperoxide resistance regulator